MPTDRPTTEPRCNYGAGWPSVVPCQLPDGHRGKHEWMRAASAGADPEPSRRAALQQAMAENGFAYQQQDGSHDLPLRDVDGVIVRLNRRGYDIVPARAQGGPSVIDVDYVAEMESAGWIVKPANEGRWVPEGEACCGPAAQIIHVQSQGGKIHMGLGERCEDNIVGGAAPRAEGLDVLERFAPIMADHPMWVERRVCNTPGCGDEDYFDHIFALSRPSDEREPEDQP